MYGVTTCTGIILSAIENEPAQMRTAQVVTTDTTVSCCGTECGHHAYNGNDRQLVLDLTPDCNSGLVSIPPGLFFARKFRLIICIVQVRLS